MSQSVFEVGLAIVEALGLDPLHTSSVRIDLAPDRADVTAYQWIDDGEKIAQVIKTFELVAKSEEVVEES